MGFIPETQAASAVMGSLRVNMQNHVHAGERVLDVTLDTISDLTHESAVLANAGLLSTIELQQALLAARTGPDVWTSLADHGSRLRDHYFRYLERCSACRHRALDRLYAQEASVDQ